MKPGCRCAGQKSTGGVASPTSVVRVSRDHRGDMWITCRWADGAEQDMPPELVPVRLLAAAVHRLQQGAALGDLADDLRAELTGLIDDFQRSGREWFLQRVLELNSAESLHRDNAEAARGINRPDLADEATQIANRARQVRDNCYWVVDTYLGGVDALPNVVPVGGARAKARAAAPRPNVGAAPVVILGAIGIVSGAALVGWIADVVRVGSERRALIDAAKDTGNTDFLDPLSEGGTWKYWAGAAFVVAALIWGPEVVERLRRGAREVASAAA